MRHLHFAALAISVAAVTPALAIDTTFDNSDLILGALSAGATDNVEINLGSPLSFKTAFANGTNLALGNINTELSAAFGSTWYDNVGVSTLLFGVSGANNSGGLGAGSANANGDFASTMYASRARSGNGVVGTANSTPWGSPTVLTGGNVSSAAANAVSQGSTFASLHGGDGILTTGNGTVNDWSDFNPLPTGSPAYTVLSGTDGISFRLGSGEFDVTGNFAGLTDVEGVVDLYRLTRYTNTSASSPTAPTIGLGTYLGSIAIQQNGDVNYIVAPVPEPGTAAMAGLSLLGLAFRRRRQAVVA